VCNLGAILRLIINPFLAFKEEYGRLLSRHEPTINGSAMGSKQRGKERKWEREHSLPPYYHNHSCRECSHFFLEFPDIGFVNKDYCNKWIKKVDPHQNACSSFGFKVGSTLRKKVRTKKRAEKEELQRSRWRRVQATTIQPPNIVLSPITPVSRRLRGATSETYPVIDGIKWPYKPNIPPMGSHSGGGGRRPHMIAYGVPSSLTAQHGEKTSLTRLKRKKKKKQK
jgi:hypothetical protein